MAAAASVNGYHPDEVAKCPFPVIPQYLAEVPLHTMRSRERDGQFVKLEEIQGELERF